MRRSVSVIVLLAVALGLILFACSSPTVNARVRVLGVRPVAFFLYVDYEIKNTGNVDFDYYEVHFEITCKDGSKMMASADGANLPAGTTIRETVLFSTGVSGIKSVTAKSVKVVNRKHGIDKTIDLQ